MVARYCTEGAAGLTSKRNGRPSNNQLPAGIASHALGLIQDSYAGFGPALACEKHSRMLRPHSFQRNDPTFDDRGWVWV